MFRGKNTVPQEMYDGGQGATGRMGGRMATVVGIGVNVRGVAGKV